MGASAMAGLRAYVFWVMLCLAAFSMDSDQAKQEEKSFSEFVSDEKNSPPMVQVLLDKIVPEKHTAAKQVKAPPKPKKQEAKVKVLPKSSTKPIVVEIPAPKGASKGIKDSTAKRVLGLTKISKSAKATHEAKHAKQEAAQQQTAAKQQAAAKQASKPVAKAKTVAAAKSKKPIVIRVPQQKVVVVKQPAEKAAEGKKE